MVLITAAQFGFFFYNYFVHPYNNKYALFNILYRVSELIVGALLFSWLMYEFPGRHAYEWQKNKKYFGAFILCMLMISVLSIFQKIGVRNSVVVENGPSGVLFNLIMFTLLEILKINRCILFFVLTKMRSSDDIF